MSVVAAHADDLEQPRNKLQFSKIEARSADAAKPNRTEYWICHPVIHFIRGAVAD